ncbi:NAD(P)-binding protein [bacterium]|nr:NAD(P)-binding protein [bacterium]
MELKNKNFLIIGAGITGISLARLLVDEDAQYVKIIDMKNHIGGNTYDYKNENGFMIHKYGPHIFHTNYDEVINLLSRFSTFHHFTHQVLVKYEDKLIPLPINETSINAISHDKDLFSKLKEVYKNQKEVSILQLLNNDDNNIKHLGELVYKNIYENYTMKM